MSAANPRSTAQQVQARVREAEILRRRIASQPFRFIAAELGMSVGGVHEAFRRAMAETVDAVRDTADEYRAVMQERLEADLFALSFARAEGDPEAIRTGLAVEKALRELKGLDAPTQITGDITVAYRLVSDGQVDDGALT